MIVTTKKKEIPLKAAKIIDANIIAVSIRYEETIILKPIPAFAPASSATMAPTTLKVADIFSAEKRNERHEGKRSLKNICFLLAEKVCIKSIASESIFFNTTSLFKAYDNACLMLTSEKILDFWLLKNTITLI